MTEEQRPVRGKRPPSGAPVTDRALSLLGVFSDRRRALTLSDLSRYSGIPLTTTLRLVGRLAEWGALERLDDGRYVIGVRLWEVASLSPRGHGVRQIAMPFMEDLYEVTHHHVLLAVREGKEAVLIERLSSRNAPHVAYRVGGRVPLRSTGVGLVLLAGMSRDFQEELLLDPPDNEPGMTTPTAEELRRILIDVTRTGVATVRRTAPSKTVSVAAPIRDAERAVVAAISILVPDGSTSANVLEPVVRATAMAISRSMGFRSEGFRGVRFRPDLDPHESVLG